LERIQEEENFKLVNMLSTKKCSIMKKAKPQHLQNVNTFAHNHIDGSEII